MNWSNLGAIADLISAIAVIASLLYVAVQVKDARKSFVAGAQQQLSETFSTFMATIWSDEDVYFLWMMAVKSPERMTDEQRERFGLIMFSMFAHFSSIFELSRIDDSFLIRYRPTMDRMLSIKQIQGWWSRQSHTYAEDSAFRRYIDRRIKEIQAQEEADPLSSSAGC